MDPVLGIVAIVLLVGSNGFFVAAEFGLVSARRTRIVQLASEGNSTARVAQKAVERLDSFIAATQLGITLSSLALGWVGEPALAPVFEGLLHALPIQESARDTVSTSLAIGISFALVTLLHIVFGELVPKSIALQRPEATALFVARPTTWFLTIFRPVIWLMNGVGNSIVRLLGFTPNAGHAAVHSVEELGMLVQGSREAGILEPAEERIARRAFDFSDIDVRQIMKPRTEVVAIPLTIKLPDLLKKIARQQFSRYPVYDSSIDSVVGILHTKDLLDVVVEFPGLLQNDGSSFRLKPILRSPLFVPETVSVDTLLERMQRTRTQFAVVIDEYGGMSGIATMEDVIEELVGEVQDEFDTEASPIQAHGEALVVDGLLAMTDIIDRFGEPEGSVESTTIGGYVAERLDRIPQVGDEVTYGQYHLRVEEMDGMRAARLRFILPNGISQIDNQA